ncbi:hypothetical protein OMAG_002226 [Candidatus Omnitrophus magneticus]|uniref:Uncharacterized protein n=1 Tax=Candidatus Omnitrophus magneticus TaxID=1609969 RepID=A0A0F0CKY2_9BACT|nr:hypothetical protein OMAG_002226 [Candidatus Omnitrophus magneticus]
MRSRGVEISRFPKLEITFLEVLPLRLSPEFFTDEEYFSYPR